MQPTYFGNPDASKEDLKRLYPELFKDILKKIKRYSNPDLPYIISGIRGSGKTALRILYHEEIKQKNNIIIILDKKYIIPSASYRKSSRLYFHLVANWILIQIHNELIKSKTLRADAQVQDLLKLMGKKIKSTFEGLLKASKLKTGIIEIDFDKITSGVPAAISKLNIPDYLELYQNILSFCPVYVLVDDVDIIFEGASGDDDILFSAFQAIGEINEEFKKLVSIIIFPSLVLERKFVSEGPETQIFRPKVKEISWTFKRLINLISLRIAQRRNIPFDLNDTKLWSEEFSSATRAMKQLRTMNISGPRDIIELANMAKSTAEYNKISPKHINSVLTKFAEYKFDDINRDYSLIYPNIGKILKRLYLEELDFSNRTTLVNSLRNFRIKLKSSKTFKIPKNWQWFWNYRPNELITILYQTSAIGAKNKKRTIYFKHEPSRNLNNDQIFVSHPLFEYWANVQ